MSSVLDRSLVGVFEAFAQAAKKAIVKALAKDDCCVIPETRCPPRCAGSIVWNFRRGATPTASVVVRNEGLERRTFEFSVTPLAGAGTEAGAGGGAESAAVVVSPASASIEPGAAARVHLRLQKSLALVPKEEYRCEFLFKGTWEQCVSISARVARDESENGEVEQRDTPGFHGPHAAERPKPRSAISWRIERGVTPEAHILVVNAGKASQRFEFSTTPLVGFNADAARLTLSTSQTELAPGAQTVLHLHLQGSAELGPGQEYRAGLCIDGFVRDEVPIRCHIEPDPTAHVEVAQGELPTHVHAHQWYHHFQCTAPCAIGQAGQSAGSHEP